MVWGLPSPPPPQLEPPPEPSLHVPLRLLRLLVLAIAIFAGHLATRQSLRFMPLTVSRETLIYKLDLFFTESPYASGILLCAITATLVVVGGLALWIAEGCAGSPLSSMWTAWRFVTDGGEYDDGALPRAVGIVLVLSGMLFFALLVGLIGESIEAKINSLKQGKGRVIETGHTLVLGWSEKFLSFAREIAKANESDGGGVIVVLSDEYTKEQMDDMVANELPRAVMSGTRIVCRQGDPVSIASLDQCSASSARSIVLLAGENCPPDMSDAKAVRSVLALQAGLDALRGHVVVEMRDVDNLPLLDLHMSKEGAAAVLPVVSHDIIGRLMIQCARQPHLAEVYEKLFGFDGCEFYFREHPTLVGTRWGEVLFAFADACPVGVRQTTKPAATPQAAASNGHGSSSWRRTLMVNPPDSYVLQVGDEVLVVAEDDDSYSAACRSEVASDLSAPPRGFPPPEWTPPTKGEENILLCGWRRDLLDMILEVDKYVSPGCVVTVLAPVPVEERRALLEEGKEQALAELH